MCNGAFGQTLASPKDPNKRCMECHGQKHIAELDPKERLSMVGTWLGREPRPADAAPAVEASLTGHEPAMRPGLFVDLEIIKNSPHAQTMCVECHSDAAALPHAAKLNLATCATTCHEAASKEYAIGSHQAAHARGDTLAPTCVSCHGGHAIVSIKDRRSNQHRLNSLFSCGECHAKHSAEGDASKGEERVVAYMASAHAKGIRESGLLSAATCSDCHSAHGVLPASDPASTVHVSNIARTCGSCHQGIEEVYAKSVHAHAGIGDNRRGAVCTDCHTAHSISRVDSAPAFLRDVIAECGECHNMPAKEDGRVRSYYQTYHDSYHGQVTRLGSSRAARCSDCHGSHDILPLRDPASRVSTVNLVGTCARCHPGADESFVKFDPHADYRDASNYPLLHGVWLYFMVMMSSVFTFFGLHTVMWFVRSTTERRKLRDAHVHVPEKTGIRRFTGLDRINHALVAITFFGLTATGIPLVFSGQGWSVVLASMFGGVEAAGLWHRFFAILLIVNLVLHFVRVGQAFMRRNCSARQWLLGPNSLFPRWKDALDCFGMFRWFVGRGGRPQLDRWTYWEKFDYWAEVGGSMIIGGSGLLLWFPVAAAKMMPGWMFNVAMIVHGYEALLAIGFIFTIHFFNAHVRPGVFPVDEVIFNGSMPEYELREQRPEEYRRLVETGGLEALRVPALPASRRRVNIIVALVSVGVGVGLLALIVLGGLGVLG